MLIKIPKISFFSFYCRFHSIKSEWRILIIFLLLFSFLSPTTTSAQIKYITRQITSKNGLPQNSVKDLAMDQNGFLWITTEGGLVSYDGMQFQVFNTSNTKYFVTERLQNINGTPDGKFYVNDANGSLYQITDNHSLIIQKGTTANGTGITILGGIPNKEFYLWIIHRKPFPPSDLNWNLNPLIILPIDEHSCLVKTLEGLKLYHDTTEIKSFNLLKYKPSKYFMDNDRVYFFSDKLELFEFDYRKDTTYSCELNSSLSKSSVFSILKNGKLIWKKSNPGTHICLNNNVYAITKHDLRKFSLDLIYNELPENCLITSVLDNPKNQVLFIGTDSKGLFVCEKRRLFTITYDTPEIGTNNAYYSQFAIDSNRIFTSFQREFSIEGAKKSTIGIKRFNFESIQKDKYGNVYYNRKDTIFSYSLKTGKEKKIYYKSGSRFTSINILNDTLTLGSQSGISQIVNDSLYFIYKVNKEIGFNPNVISEGPDHRFWIASCTGLYILSNDHSKLMTIAQLRNKCIRALFTYKDKLFIGTYGSGYYIWQQGNLTKMPVDVNSYLDLTHSFQTDDKGNLYLSTNHGLFRVQISAIDSFLKDHTSKISYWYYGDQDGITNIEFNGGCSPSSIKLANGYFSFPSMEGMVFFNPDKITDAPLNYPIYINYVKSDRVKINGGPDYQIPDNTELVEIKVAAPFWGNKENLHLEYKLSGTNKNWVPLAANEFSFTFSNLNSGSHELIIRKKSSFKTEEYVSTSLTLNVSEKYYETIWFKFLIIILSGLILQLILHLYGKNIRKRNQLLEDNVKKRTQELQHANETLGINNKKLLESENQLIKAVKVKDKLISIISHDIIAPLKFISLSARLGYGKLKEKDPAFIKETMQDISGSSEKLFDNAINMLNWIKFQNNRIEVVKNMESPFEIVEEMLGSMREMAKSKKVDLINLLSMDDVMQTDRRILSIILQNIVSNAIRFTENGNITVSTVNKQDYYCIKITDTGSGMNQKTLEKVRATCDQMSADIRIDLDGRSGSGLGYLIISELLNLLKGKITIQSEEGMGTEIEICLPL